MSVAMGWDDLRLGAICQTNLEIAGSPRNIFWYSAVYTMRGRALNGSWGSNLSQPIKLRIHGLEHSSQTCRAKLISQKGNSPDSQLRPLNQS